MGWTSFKTQDSFKEVFLKEINSDGYEVLLFNIVHEPPLNYNVEEAVIYAAVRHPNGYVFGLVTKFQRDKEGEVYFKFMDESVGPYNYDISPEVFKLLSPIEEIFEDGSEYAKNWRKKVKEKLGLLV